MDSTKLAGLLLYFCLHLVSVMCFCITYTYTFTYYSMQACYYVRNIVLVNLAHSAGGSNNVTIISREGERVELRFHLRHYHGDTSEAVLLDDDGEIFHVDSGNISCAMHFYKDFTAVKIFSAHGKLH